MATNATLTCLETCSLYSIGMGSENTAISSNTSDTPSDTYAAVVLREGDCGRVTVVGGVHVAKWRVHLGIPMLDIRPQIGLDLVAFRL